MVKLSHGVILYLISTVMASPVSADGNTVTIPMHAKSSGAYYLDVSFNGAVTNNLMFDTGSEFLVINAVTLKTLIESSQVEYLYDITGVMANGSEIKVPVYRLSSLSIGCCCIIQDITAAVFPGNTREILGLTALKKVAPFSVSLEPAVLTLNNCGTAPPSNTEINHVYADESSEHPEIASMTETRATSLLP